MYDFSLGLDHQEQETKKMMLQQVSNVHAQSSVNLEIGTHVVYWIDASNTLTWYLGEL